MSSQTHKIEASFEIVTPMFLGGSEHQVDGIRPASIKGALRFWWRAMQWQHHYDIATQNTKNDTHEKREQAALKSLHSEEARIFGLASKTIDGKEVGGQGCFLLTVSHKPLTTTDKLKVHPQLKDCSGARYLGYGLMVAFAGKATDKKPKTDAGELIRECINENQTFIVTLHFRKGVEQSVVDALYLFGLIGGLGSRSRKGYGSVVLTSLIANGQNEITPKNNDEYKKMIVKLIGSSQELNKESPFTGFWKNSRVEITNSASANNAYDVLNNYANAMLDYRSWGSTERTKNILPSRNKSEFRFKNDHDWCRDVKKFKESNPTFHPQRVVFGLPHDYGKDEKDHVNGAEHDRRSSPLFFHVHKIGIDYFGVAVFLPSLFLPIEEKIKAGKNPVDQKIDWSVINNFLDGRVGDTPKTPKLTAPYRFSNKVKII